MLALDQRDVLETDTATTLFVSTSISQAIQDAASFAQSFRRAAAITGPAGIGKSTTLRRLAENNPLALYGEARDFRRPTHLYQFMVAGFDLPLRSAKSAWNLREIIHEWMPQLVARGCILFIDEMQELTLDTMREVVGYSEDHRLPVVLVGNERSLRVRPRMDTYTFDQILSRISKVTRLQTPTARDYAEFASRHGLTDPQAVAACAAYGQRTSFRRLRDLLAVALASATEPASVDRTCIGAALQAVTDGAGDVRLLQPLSKSA